MSKEESYELLKENFKSRARALLATLGRTK
jgi:hypothetical protein